MPFTIIIPAHNEEAVITRCLTRLTDGLGAGECQTLVVANACSDRTVERARAFPGVEVIDTPEGGKGHALNLGDAAARHFPRLYLDADILLDAAAARAIAAQLQAGPHLALSPRFEPELQGRSALVRHYYRIWTQLPYLREGAIGNGLYALSAAGRARFERFPRLIADDAFVRSHFAPHERGLCAAATARFYPPKRLIDLLRMGLRIRFGNRQLLHDRPEARRGTRSHTGGQLLMLLRDPGNWVSLPIYLAITLTLEVGARLWRRLGLRGRWLRDQSGRSD